MIPRGSNEFVRAIMDNTAHPVMATTTASAISYLNGLRTRDGDPLSLDSKTQYVAVCNAPRPAGAPVAAATSWMSGRRPAIGGSPCSAASRPAPGWLREVRQLAYRIPRHTAAVKDRLQHGRRDMGTSTAMGRTN